jgi:AcrR family transcriptional regulator
MADAVNTPGKRKYDGSRRLAAARESRERMARAAQEAFLLHGYAATRMADIAEAAGVSLETLYAAFGPKPKLVRHLIEIALSGQDKAVPALERQWVRAAQAQRDPGRLIELLAHGATELEQRVAPIWRVAKEAAADDPALQAAVAELTARRLSHMRVFIDDLASKGGLRPGLSRDSAADAVWAMNSPEFFGLFVLERGWSSSAFESWLANTWKFLLLPDDKSQ